MTPRSHVLAAVALFTFLTANVPGADPEKAAASGQASADQDVYDGYDFSPSIREINGRFGYWAMDWRGSRTKIGEFQDLNSFPFWDVDSLLSDAHRTVDFTLTGTDNEGVQGRLDYFDPGLSVKFDYNRYFRRLDSRGVLAPNPFEPGNFIFENFNPDESTDGFLSFARAANPNFPDATRRSAHVLNSDVLNPGEDYAIRVQQFQARFHGPIAENLKWRLNVWGIDRQGVRQATKMAHCFNETTVGPVSTVPASTDARLNSSRCHILAQSQQIDWMTTEVEPVLEAKIGPIVAEYSRTMRAFNTDDQLVGRQYSFGAHSGWPATPTQLAALGLPTDVPYDVQAENFTQIDRLKLSWDVDEFNHWYAFGYVGDTRNILRDTERFFNGFDVRWTNDRLEGLKWTAYIKKANESGELPPSFPEANLIQGPQTAIPPFSPPGDGLADYHNPVNYDRTGAGIKFLWRPAESGWPAARGLGINAGYDYALTQRDHVAYEAEDGRWIFALGATEDLNQIDTWVFTQPDTVSHTLYVGPSMRWSSRFESYLRYKYINTPTPLFGFRAINGEANTNQPNQSHLIEIGGTWTPTDNFLVSATFGVEARNHDSPFNNGGQAFTVLHANPEQIGFDEYNYPIVVSAWYAPSPELSFTAGYASFTNWIEQNIVLGDQFDDGLFNPLGFPIANPANGTGPYTNPFIGSRDYFEPDAFQSLWRYGSSSQVVSLGTAYACTERLKLTGGYEYTWSRAAITAAPDPGDFGLTANNPADTAARASPVSDYGGVPPAQQTPNWDLIPSLSDVVVQTNRVTAGADYLVRPRIVVFFRYNLFDYRDLAGTQLSGTVHGWLGGMSAVF